MRQLPMKRMAAALLAAAALAAVMNTSLLYRADSAVSDGLYQRPQALEGNIALVGIDEKSLEALGPYQTWGRELMASAIETLNKDPENRPAVIGIDVVYTGVADEPADQRLVEAAGRWNNVVLACFADFGTGGGLVTREDGTFYMDDFAIDSFNEPFPALKAVVQEGHINAMYDDDGILRHGILSLRVPDGRVIPSFNYQIYQIYAKAQGLDEALVPPRDSLNRWYIPYSALPGGYSDGYSFSDLIAGNLPADHFAGKVVLIGPYAAGLMDSVTASIDHAQTMYGVEHQANAIDALIAGNFKEEVSESIQTVVLFLVSFGFALWFWNRRMLPATLVWIIFIAGAGGLAYGLYEAGYVIHVLWVPLSVTILFMATMAANYAKAALEKARVTNTFKRYVAPEVVNEILKEGADALELGGKLTDIAVLFVDIRGFTPMSELLEPAQVVEILNRYLNLTSTCIMKHGGTLDKFVGDATMAIWGAPLPQKDYVMNAAKAAMEMVSGSQELSRELEERFGRTVSFGIGVHCGKAVVGNIGAKMRMDYTAIGDTVNTAARLEANAKGGKILISRAVADALEGRIEATSLGDSIALKGKSAGFEVLLLEGILEEAETLLL